MKLKMKEEYFYTFTGKLRWRMEIRRLWLIVRNFVWSKEFEAIVKDEPKIIEGGYWSYNIKPTDVKWKLFGWEVYRRKFKESDIK